MTEPQIQATSLANASHVHFVGIGGAGMGALATLLLEMGKTISGSDLGSSPTTALLIEKGARVIGRHEAGNVGVGVEYVIRSAAVPDDNPEVLEAQRRSLPNVKLAQAVGELSREKQTVGIAGTHGKTTTTALAAWLLEQGGQDPTALIGAEALNFSSSAKSGEGPLVVEADEYDRRFLALSPEVAVVTSVEPDHLDYFGSFEEILDVFQQFVDKVPQTGRLIVCADDGHAPRLNSRAQRDTYGFAEGSTWRASDFTATPGGGARFTLHTMGRSWPAETALVGEHNVRNALAAIAVADYFGVGIRAVLAALPAFRGTRRRFETKGHPGDVWVVDDYAHHPTAVSATLSAARAAMPRGQVWAVFQPHTTNRTHALMDEFAAAFDEADHVVLLPIYKPSGRELHGATVTSDDLARRIQERGHRDVRVASTFDEAREVLRERVDAGDLVLTMGAGDVTRLADELLAEFSAAPRR